jgi:hypothetical protein
MPPGPAAEVNRAPADSGAAWIRSSRAGLVLVTSRVGDPRGEVGGECHVCGG